MSNTNARYLRRPMSIREVVVVVDVDFVVVVGVAVVDVVVDNGGK